MHELVIALACVGGTAVIIGLGCLIAHFQELFERVERLEVNDDERQEDIISIRSQIKQINARMDGEKE